MNTMKYLLFPACFFLSLYLTGCEEIIDMDVTDSLPDAIVFEGVVTNEAEPYCFRLTRPLSLSESDEVPYQGIDDARMVLTDVTEGVKDTLVPVSHYRDGWNRIYFHYHNYFTQTNDTLWVHDNKLDTQTGLYVTTRIRGTEGHSYVLDIDCDGKHYRSDVQKMEPALVINDITYQMVDLGVKGESPAPCISFTNPAGPNYYLFTHDPYSVRQPSLYRLLDSKKFWTYSIVKDDYLEEEVKDFIIADGENAYGYGPGWNYFASDSIFIKAQTISKSCYDIYHQMIEQLRTNGGAYTPAPGNIRSNISGGNVYGCFRVSAVSEKGVAMDVISANGSITKSRSCISGWGSFNSGVSSTMGVPSSAKASSRSMSITRSLY